MKRDEVILSVDGLSVCFPVKVRQRLLATTRLLRAVDEVSLEIGTGETLGVVGESGCGKSTLGRAILQLIPSTSGTVHWLGRELGKLDSRAMRDLRKDLQIIFQDPLASLDPRMTIGEIIAEPLKIHQPGLPADMLQKRVVKTMETVGLLAAQTNRYPHEFSGGQCQRIGIARAMILNPRLIICDEPVSALDVSIQAQIVNLLMDLQQRVGISLLFISHDLSVVRHISHRIMVLYLGRVVEHADRDSLYATPLHPYTRALISAVPIPDPVIERGRRHQILGDDLPSPLSPPPGCLFHTRCPYAESRCRQHSPVLEQAAAGHQVACHRWRELSQPAMSG